MTPPPRVDNVPFFYRFFLFEGFPYFPMLFFSFEICSKLTPLNLLLENVLFQMKVCFFSHSVRKRISVFQFVSTRSASRRKKIRLTVFLPSFPKDISYSISISISNSISTVFLTAFLTVFLTVFQQYF